MRRVTVLTLNLKELWWLLSDPLAKKTTESFVVVAVALYTITTSAKNPISLLFLKLQRNLTH